MKYITETFVEQCEYERASGAKVSFSEDVSTAAKDDDEITKCLFKLLRDQFVKYYASA